MASEREPLRLAELIVAHGADLVGAGEAICAAWVRIADAAIFEPTHDVLSLRGRGHALILGWQNDPGWGWRERERRPAWGRNDYPDMGQPRVACLDRSGTMFAGAGRRLRVGQGGRHEGYVVADRGRDVTVQGSGHSLLGAVLLHNAKSCTVLSGTTVSASVPKSNEAYSAEVARIVSGLLFS